ncbi:MAG: N-terminal cleavage protein, partial [Phycisphaerales bacterium]|nr:N-terminal cleavage protein [Phycisphaerales bacterium]
MRIRNNRQKQGQGTTRGFTLVELLVVIGIIGLLISILLPSLNKARQAASAIKCLSNLRQMGVLTQLYANAYKNSLPPAEYHRLDDKSTPGSNVAVTWGALLAQQMRVGTGVAIGNAPNDPNGADANRQRQMFICPDAVTAPNGAAVSNTYSSHPLLVPVSGLSVGVPNGYPGPHPFAARFTQRRPYRLNNIRRSGEIILYFDATLYAASTFAAQTDGYNIDFNRLNANNSGAPQTHLLTGYPLAAPADMNASIDYGLNIDTKFTVSGDPADATTRTIG